jgi:hypothetical protein
MILDRTNIIYLIKQNLMPGRGDNNKNGAAGRGSSNQSSQGFNGDGEMQKSNHSKKHTGGKPSQPSPKSADHDANRNQPLKEEKQKGK